MRRVATALRDSGAFFFVGVGGGAVIAVVISGSIWDFGYDWLVARAVLRGVDPYQTLAELARTFDINPGALDFIHPRLPGALVFLAPIGLLPFGAVYMTGRLLVVASAALLALVLGRITGGTRWYLAFIPAALLVWPFSQVLEVSQTGFLVAALVGMAYVFEGWRGGVPLGIAILLKLWPWVLVPALWLAGRRKVAVTAAVTFLAANGVGLLLPHVSLTGIYAGLIGIESAGFLDRSISPLGSFDAYPWIAASIIVLYLALVRVRPAAADWATAIALGVAPLVWPTYLPALLVPIALTARRVIENVERSPVPALNPRR